MKQSIANVDLQILLLDSIKYYCLRNEKIQFSYSGREYEIRIIDVFVFPQCYAAIADKLREYGRENLIVDIGSKTIDVIHTRNYVPVESESTSIPAALIQCMEGIKSNVYQNCNRRLSEDMIQQMILENDVNIPTDCKVIIRAGLADFAKGMEAKLAELGFDLEMFTVIYAGGGAMLMKNYGTLKGANIHYLEDIRANAKGYEFLAKQKGKF